MSNTQKTLPEAVRESLASIVPCVVCLNKNTDAYSNWWSYPHTDIDYGSLKSIDQELPVYSAPDAEESPFFGVPFLYRVCPEDKYSLEVFVPYGDKIHKWNYSGNAADSPVRIVVYTDVFRVAIGTKLEVIETLLWLNSRSDLRVKLDYGDLNTLKSWNEEFDVTGRIGASTGEYSTFILVHNSRSAGGSPILTHCILSITATKKQKGAKKHKIYYELTELFTDPLHKVTY